MKKILSIISILILISMSGCIMDNSAETEPSPAKRGTDQNQDVDEDEDIIYLCVPQGSGETLEISGTKEDLEKAEITIKGYRGHCNRNDYEIQCKKHVDTEKGITWQFMVHDTSCGAMEDDDGTIDYSRWVW